MIGGLQILALFHDPTQYDEFQARRWKRKKKSIDPPSVTGKPFLLAFAYVAGPFCLRVFYLFIFIIWLPILTTVVSRDAVSHNFKVLELSEGGSKHPDTIRFEGHAWMIGGLHHPPTAVWDAVEIGDTIRLSGKGNRWGVFYDEIELIKQQ